MQWDPMWGILILANFDPKCIPFHAVAFILDYDILFTVVKFNQTVKFCAKNHCYFRCYRAQASWASSGKLTCEGSAVQSSACAAVS